MTILKLKPLEVNGHLQRFCFEKNSFLKEHPKTFHPIYINKNELHLTKLRTSILSNNFVKAVSNILDWREIEGNDLWS